MREIRTSSSMRGRRKRATAQRACALLYRSPWLACRARGVRPGELRSPDKLKHVLQKKRRTTGNGQSQEASGACPDYWRAGKYCAGYAWSNTDQIKSASIRA